MSWVGSGAPGEIRTPDLLLRRQPLYPAELRARTDIYSLHGQGRGFNVEHGDIVEHRRHRRVKAREHIGAQVEPCLLGRLPHRQSG